MTNTLPLYMATGGLNQKTKIYTHLLKFNFSWGLFYTKLQNSPKKSTLFFLPLSVRIKFTIAVQGCFGQLFFDHDFPLFHWVMFVSDAQNWVTNLESKRVLILIYLNQHQP